MILIANNVDITINSNHIVGDLSVCKMFLTEDCTKWSAVLVTHVQGIQQPNCTIHNIPVGGDPIEELKKIYGNS